MEKIIEKLQKKIDDKNKTESFQVECAKVLALCSIAKSLETFLFRKQK